MILGEGKIIQRIEDASAALREQALADTEAEPTATARGISRPIWSSDVGLLWEANAETWTRHARAGYDIYRDILNTPAFLAMLPPVGGLNGLDIGCGEGENTRSVARLGARMHAVDIAPTFIRHAREAELTEPLGIQYSVGDSTNLEFPAQRFDFACSFMAFMDMPDQQAAMQEAYRVIKPGGFFQFSILHPCFVPPHRKVIRDNYGAPLKLEIARYFAGIDGEIESWHFQAAPASERLRSAPFRIPLFHRTLTEWVDIIVSSGFTIEKLAEPCASQDQVAAEPRVADTRIAPLFMHFRLRKHT